MKSNVGAAYDLKLADLKKSTFFKWKKNCKG